MFKSETKTKTATLVLIFVFFIFLWGYFVCNPAQGQKTVKQNNVVSGKCITLDSATWILRINQLSYVAQKLRQSDLPSKEVALITDSVLTAFQIELYQQVIKK